MSSFTRKGDFWAGLVMAALGMFVVTQAYAWDYMTEDGPGAGFFPLWYGAVMVTLSLLLVAGAILKEGAKAKTVRWDDRRRAFGLLIWFIIAVMFGRPQRIALPYAIGGAVGFYALFTLALELQLPAGTLF